jgi:hypothetical protein
MSVDINTGGTNTNIPEELGRFKVNILQNGVNVSENVKELWAKTSASASTPELVWKITDTPITTNISTQTPVDPTCGVCLNDPVFYPFMPELGTRWNCGLWKNTGKFDNINPTPVETVDSAFNLAGYEVYVKNTGAPEFTPPPPGYILADYVTFTVKDRMAMYIRKPLELFNGTYYALPTPPLGSDPFDPDVFCSISCGGNACYESGYTPYPFGGGPTCVSIGDIANGTVTGIIQQNMLFDSGCTATAEGCITSCYGKPTNFQTVCECRNVGSYLPPIKTDMVKVFDNDFNLINIPAFARYASDTSSQEYTKDIITFKDLSFMLESGCESGESSAWQVRIFLPIYVALPSSRRNKYIKILLDNDQFVQTDPVLNAAFDVAYGKIPAASLLMSKDPVTLQTNWGVIGYPKEGVHTHVAVLEIVNPINTCNVCINAGGGDINPSILRFYPITDALGTFLPNFKEYVESNIQLPSKTTRYGVNTINSAAEQNPNLSNYGYYYTDTGIKSNVPANTSLTYDKYLNSYYQPQINSGSTAYDCNCNPI